MPGLLQKISDDVLTVCPACGPPLRQALTAAGFQLKDRLVRNHFRGATPVPRKRQGRRGRDCERRGTADTCQGRRGGCRQGGAAAPASLPRPPSPRCARHPPATQSRRVRNTSSPAGLAALAITIWVLSWLLAAGRSLRALLSATQASSRVARRQIEALRRVPAGVCRAGVGLLRPVSSSQHLRPVVVPAMDADGRIPSQVDLQLGQAGLGHAVLEPRQGLPLRPCWCIPGARFVTMPSSSSKPGAKGGAAACPVIFSVTCDDAHPTSASS